MSFTSSHSQESGKVLKEIQPKRKREDSSDEKKSGLEDQPEQRRTGMVDMNLEMYQLAENDGDVVLQNNPNEKEKKKKKRKRKMVDDLRFEAAIGKPARTKRQERKKEFLQSRKNKHKKNNKGDDLDFPIQEKIKFGDVVQAPPKLVSVPKAFKQNVSQERLRLQAIEAYRNRKGWVSRPGSQLPSIEH